MINFDEIGPKLAIYNWEAVKSDMLILYENYVNMNQMWLCVTRQLIKTSLFNGRRTIKLRKDYLRMKRTRKYKDSDYLVDQKLHT